MAGKNGLYINAGTSDLRWLLRRAALDRRTSLQGLVVPILEDWLRREGYLPEAAGAGTQPLEGG